MLLLYTSLIKSQIKRATKNLFVLNFILLIISIVISVCYWSEFHNKILGPKEVKVGEISNLKISGLTARNYVKVSPEKKASTGLQYVESEYDSNNQEKSKTVKTVYYVLRDGQDLIFTAVPKNNVDVSSYTGWVRKMTDEEKSHLDEAAIKLKASGDFTVSEYILDADDFSSAYFWYFVCGMIAIFNIFNICKCIKYTNCPEQHKIYKNLMKYGNPDEVINSIEEELPNDSFSNNKKIYLLKSWILSSKRFSFDVYKIDDIVWAYKKVTNHTINFMPAGKTHELILHLYNKSQCSIGLKENQADSILTSIMQMYPWIIVGFNDEINREWKSNSSQFINYVQAEKQRMIDEKNNTYYNG